MDFPFAETSIAIIAIGTLLAVVKAFLSHIQKKDESFTNVVTNHLHSDAELKQKLIDSNDGLTKSIDKLQEKL